MASIRTRKGPSGTHFQVLFRESGRQRSATFATAGDAQRFVNLIDRMGATSALDVLDARDGTSAADPTVAEYVSAYIDTLDSLTDFTRHTYRATAAKWIDTQPIGAMPITAVTPDHVRAWLRRLEEAGTLAAKTRKNYHALLSAAFSHAIDEQLRGTNPARGLKVRDGAPARPKVFLSAGELAVLVGAFPAQYQPLVVFLAGTGMRWGEATALQVGSVDLDAPTPVAYVTRAWTKVSAASLSGQRVGPPKTRAGIRTVSLPAEVVQEIQPLIEGRASDALIFTTGRGSQILHRAFSKEVWHPALDRLNARTDKAGNPKEPALAKRPRIHDLRHTHASQLIQAGVPLTIIQRRLGHTSIQTTSDVYGHLAPDHLEVAALAASLGLRQAVPEVLEIEG